MHEAAVILLHGDNAARQFSGKFHIVLAVLVFRKDGYEFCQGQNRHGIGPELDISFLLQHIGQIAGIMPEILSCEVAQGQPEPFFHVRQGIGGRAFGADDSGKSGRGFAQLLMADFVGLQQGIGAAGMAQGVVGKDFPAETGEISVVVPSVRLDLRGQIVRTQVNDLQEIVGVQRGHSAPSLFARLNA